MNKYYLINRLFGGRVEISESKSDEIMSLPKLNPSLKKVSEQQITTIGEHGEILVENEIEYELQIRKL